MTVKLLLLKSGEDLIADVQEMVVGDDDQKRVVGYFLNKPCVIKMIDPNIIPTDVSEDQKKASFQVSLYPWMPLSADKNIPIPSDWVVTIVQPTAKLKEMYIEDVVKYGEENDQDPSINEQSNSNQSN